MKPATKFLLAAGVAIALSGCGALPEPSNYNQVWADTQACTGLTASKPEAVVIPDALWSQFVTDDANAKYDDKTETITVKEKHQRDPKLISHEMTHHLLYKNYGDPDSDHVNELFGQCGYAT